MPVIRVFVYDEVEKVNDKLAYVKENYRCMLGEACCTLSFFDWIRFSKLNNRTFCRLPHQTKTKKGQNVTLVGENATRT